MQEVDGSAWSNKKLKVQLWRVGYRCVNLDRTMEWETSRSLVLSDLSRSFNKRRKRAERFAQFKERMLK
jgi:hypothetical protein